MSAVEFAVYAVTGLCAGVLGGLLGIGGSVVMIPVLTLLFHRDQHVSQAAAMIVNVFVSVPALIRHRRAGAVEWRIVWRMLPAGLATIVVGVEVGNRLGATVLMRLFGIFLAWVVIDTVLKLFSEDRLGEEGPTRSSWARSSSVAAVTCFAGGLLGIGGGIIAVPLLQLVCRLPLRQAIACSSAVMCMTSAVGAVSKNALLGSLTDDYGLALDPRESLLLASALAPTAVIGGLIGAGLTHVLPLRWVRMVFAVLAAMASAKFLGWM